MDETPYEQKDLLSAEDVARYFGVGQMTVYRWCKEGRLRCMKLGKHWRIRREALEDFLKQHEHSATLVGQLGSFLRVPDNVLAIAQNIDILHRLDAAFFPVGDAHGGLLVKLYGSGEARRAGILWCRRAGARQRAGDRPGHRHSAPPRRSLLPCRRRAGRAVGEVLR